MVNALITVQQGFGNIILLNHVQLNVKIKNVIDKMGIVLMDA